MPSFKKIMKFIFEAIAGSALIAALAYGYHYYNTHKLEPIYLENTPYRTIEYIGGMRIKSDTFAIYSIEMTSPSRVSSEKIKFTLPIKINCNEAQNDDSTRH